MENNSNSKNTNILIGNTSELESSFGFIVIALFRRYLVYRSSSGMGLPDYSVFTDGGDPHHIQWDYSFGFNLRQ